jgi:hypothetical protein
VSDQRWGFQPLGHWKATTIRVKAGQACFKKGKKLTWVGKRRQG